MKMLMRTALALAAPLLLWGCVLTPGKFVSSLTINADRTFVFAYKGEVLAIEPSTAMKGNGESSEAKSVEGEDASTDDAPKPESAAEGEADADTDAKNREIAAALMKEAGYRSVVYRGKGKFDIDYMISGNLTHAFVFPFNVDAQAILPFVMVEVREGGTVRVRAPGFASNQSSGAGLGGMSAGSGNSSKYLDGVFTLDTNAEIVSQNNEDGSKTSGARKQIAWRATPLTRDAPLAVLRLK